MRLSPTERILAGVCLLCLSYRYLTGNWPIGIEVDQS
jgi:hypothetical protein